MLQYGWLTALAAGRVQRLFLQLLSGERLPGSADGLYHPVTDIECQVPLHHLVGQRCSSTRSSSLTGLNEQVICGVGVLIVTFGFPNVKNVEAEEELCGADASKQTRLSRSMSSLSEAASNMAEENLDEALSTSEGFKETLLFGFKNPRFGLFIPIILYNGMSLGFFLSDATRYFIAEAIGAPLWRLLLLHRVA